MRLAGQAKGGFYPTPPRVSDRIGGQLQGAWLGTPMRQREEHIIRVLDPCCGDGEAVERVMNHISYDRGLEHEIYGVELHKERAVRSMERFDKVLNVDFFTSMIGNEAFSMLFLNPPYDFDNEDGRVEHAFLVRATRYLMLGGALVFIIPRSKLAVSARYLSINYTNLTTFYFPEPEREQFDQIVVFGNKGHGGHMASIVEQNLVRLARVDEPEPLPPSPRYRTRLIKSVPKGDVMWTTMYLDKDTMFDEARRAGLWGRKEITEAFAPVDTQRERPLMPLRKGHMGMLIAAGFLDNLMLENEEGNRVLVKGKTVKIMELVDETENSEVFREKMKTSVLALDLNSGEMLDVV